MTFSHVSKFETLCKLEASQQHDCCLTVFAVLKDSKLDECTRQTHLISMLRKSFMHLSQYSSDIFSHIANRGVFTKAVRFRRRLLSFLDYRLLRNTKYFSLQKLFACNNNSAESSHRNLQQNRTKVVFACRSRCSKSKDNIIITSLHTAVTYLMDNFSSKR